MSKKSHQLLKKLTYISIISSKNLLIISFHHTMAARTNKRGIAAKKTQLAKQAGRMRGAPRFTYPKRKLSLDEAKDCGAVGVQTNPKGKTYSRFLRGRKICRETRMRSDPDGYRFIKLPSGGSDFAKVTLSGWGRKKMMKNTSKVV